ncbi:MAG: hypothetical protein ACYDHH_07725 [Solirubrobacteraceae bacterium]
MRTAGPRMLDRGRPLRRGMLAQPRTLVALTLIVAGLIWAIARGVRFYGISPVHVGYDLDQPPLLLVVVGCWLMYRSRRR